MPITMNTALPPLPKPAAFDPSKPVSIDVEYFVPMMTREHLGGTPEDVFNQSPDPIEGPYTPCTPEKCGLLPNEIYRDNPIRDLDGAPKMRLVKKRLEDAPKSPLNAGVLWGLVGGATAGTIGLLGGAIIGAPAIGGVVGGLVGALVAGGAGTLANRGDRIRLVYDQHTIKATTYVGFKEEISPREQDGVQGYLHRFTPDLRVVNLGEYKVPRLEHYRESR